MVVLIVRSAMPAIGVHFFPMKTSHFMFLVLVASKMLLRVFRTVA